MKPEFLSLNPVHIWEHFYQITQIPRPSHQEMQMREYIIGLAEQFGHPWKSDKAGNLVIYLPGTSGLKHRPMVVIQNHMDMVTVKTEDKSHDFSCDPLQLQEVDGWITADRTTLGADNGLGCAAAIALMTDDQVAHPPLELLFTVAEEIGLHGALGLDASMISGKRMLNLDGESWGQIYIGCAGGQSWQFSRNLETESVPALYRGFQLTLDGLTGGHSGLHIHQQLGNAIKLLAEWLMEARPFGVRLSSLQGGVAQNVMPHTAEITFCCPADSITELEVLNEQMLSRWRSYLPKADHELRLEITELGVEHVLKRESQLQVEQLLNIFPHGAVTYNLDQPADLVNLSINLGVIKLKSGHVYIESSARFFDANEALGLANRVLDIAQVFHLFVEEVLYYPAWKPNFDNALLTLAKELYAELFGSKPVAKAIHAGLECGILKSKLGEIDIISFGPTITGAHSPSEMVEIETVASFWVLLTELLKKL